MYHLRLKGEHYQMGVKRGKIFQKCNITFPLHLDDFQMKYGRESERILKGYFPEVCEEIRGISDTIGVGYITFASWLLCMGCCMYNLEDNIPVEIRGCTAFAYSKDGKVIYGRNNDLPPYLKSGSKSEIYSPSNGNKFNITTSSFINGEEGLNEHGLAVAMTFVMTSLEKIRAGFNSCFIVRYLLEKADSTDNAISMLMELPIASNCNILIADKSGKMFVIECTPFTKRIREAENVDGGKIGAVLSQSPKGLDKAPKGTAIDLVINEGDKPVPDIIGKSVDEAKGMLEQAGLKLGEIKKVQDASAKKNVVLACTPGVGSNLNDGAAVAITVAAGGEKKSAYVDFVVPSGKPANVRIVLTDDNGTATLYSGTQNGSVRLRQKVEYAGNAKVQFICDGKLISERNL